MAEDWTGRNGPAYICGMSNTSAWVAANVRRLRTAQGLSLRELEARLDEQGHPIGYTSLSRLETAKQGCSVDDLAALAQALGAPPAHLMSDPVAMVQEEVVALVDRYWLASSRASDAEQARQDALTDLRERVQGDPAAEDAAVRYMGREGGGFREGIAEAIAEQLDRHDAALDPDTLEAGVAAVVTSRVRARLGLANDPDAFDPVMDAIVSARAGA